jgi:hypothetical protein
LKKLKRTVSVAAAASLLLLSVSAAPTFAFIHAYIPAGYCPQPAAHEAADNPIAEDHLPRVPIEQPPAPDYCPATQ